MHLKKFKIKQITKKEHTLNKFNIEKNLTKVELEIEAWSSSHLHKAKEKGGGGKFVTSLFGNKQ